MFPASNLRRSGGRMLSARDSAWQEDRWSRFGLKATRLQTQNHSLQIWVHAHQRIQSGPRAPVAP